MRSTRRASCHHQHKTISSLTTSLMIAGKIQTSSAPTLGSQSSKKHRLTTGAAEMLSNVKSSMVMRTVVRSYQCHNHALQTLKCAKTRLTQISCSQSYAMRSPPRISTTEMISSHLLRFRKKSSAGTLQSESQPSAATLKRLKLKVTTRMIQEL